MIALTLPLLAVLLLTSQYIHAYPSASFSGIKTYHPINLRLKRDYGSLHHHELANNYNDELASNFEETLPYIYAMLQRQTRKRLIDF